MNKHLSQYISLGDLVGFIRDDVNNEDWFRVMGLEIEGYDDALALIGDDDDEISGAAIDSMEDLERNYIETHRNEIYKISWPDHVSCPKFNDDANYQYLGTVSFKTYTITDGECRKTGEWMHYVCNDQGIVLASYEDDRTISDSSDPRDIARTAARELGMPAPDFVENDDDSICFGYEQNEASE